MSLRKGFGLYSTVCRNTPENVRLRSAHLCRDCNIAFLFLGQVSCLSWDSWIFFARSCRPTMDHVDSYMVRRSCDHHTASDHRTLLKGLDRLLILVDLSHHVAVALVFY